MREQLSSRSYQKLRNLPAMLVRWAGVSHCTAPEGTAMPACSRAACGSCLPSPATCSFSSCQQLTCRASVPTVM